MQMSHLPARRIGEVSLAEDDAVERNVKFDIDRHAALGALYVHLGDLWHVEHHLAARHLEICINLHVS